VKIIVDTREQAPYLFAEFDAVEREFRRLPTGDYTVDGHGDIVIERKSGEDFLNSITHERDRFEREFERLQAIPSAHVIVEMGWPKILSGEFGARRISVHSVTGTVISWTIKYPNVHWWFADNRSQGEELVVRLLSKYFDYQAKVSKALVKGF